MGKPLKKKLEEGPEDAKDVISSKRSRRASTSTNDDEATVNGASSSKKGHNKSATAGSLKSGKTAKNGKANRTKASSAKKNNKLNNSEKNRASSTQVEESEDGTDGEYEVESIVGHKVEGGKSYYLIRWKGYTEDDDSWALESSLSCPDLIEKFKKKQSTNGSASASKKSKEKESKKKTDKKGASTKNKVNSSAKENEDIEWEVEKIIAYAEEREGRVFRIRWKGYKAKDDTWEPERNLHCDEMIEQFMKKMEAQENVSVKELRENPSKPKRLLNETSRRMFALPSERKSKRSSSKKMVYYGDSDE